MATLEQLFKFLGQGWVGSVIGLVSLLLALVLYVLYRRARIGPRLVYQRRATYLISSGQSALPDEVSISFKGVVVSRLTATYIVLWNAGTETVRGSDVVTADPLRFLFPPGTQVLRARVVRSTRSVIEFQASTSPHAANEALWGFDYLDAGDGAVVEILHTGEERYPQVQGTIRGLPEGLRDWGRVLPQEGLLPPPFARIPFRLVSAVGIGFGLALAASGVAFRTGDAWVRVGTGVFYVATFALMLWMIRRRFPRSLVTDELA